MAHVLILGNIHAAGLAVLAARADVTVEQVAAASEAELIRRVPTADAILVRTNKVIQHEIDVTRHQLMRNSVELIPASASFCGPHTLRLDFIDGTTARTVTAHTIVIATGTETTRDSHIPRKSAIAIPGMRSSGYP